MNKQKKIVAEGDKQLYGDERDKLKGLKNVGNALVFSAKKTDKKTSRKIIDTEFVELPQGTPTEKNKLIDTEITR